MERTLTRDEALKRLRGLASDRDRERAHVAADDVLCQLLLTLGYGDVVKAWIDIEKWYS